ncbi:armadillo-type protein [Mycena vulgaris]|nr:armadillo-type protein [Mycena vulgaris]
MLESPNDEFRSQTCMILARLSCHETAVAAVLAINPCERLVSILQDDNAQVVENGVYALYCLATWQEGAQALVDAGVLECTETLLSSGEASIRRLTWGILARLLQQAPTLPAIADLVVKLFNQLTSLLRDEARHGTALDVMESGAHALFWSIRFSEGAQEAMLLDCLWLLESRNFEVRKVMCEMLRDLACHKSTAMAVLSVDPCPELVSLLRDTNIEVIQSAAEALRCIATCPEGALAVVDAKVLDHVAELSKSPETDVRIWTCQLLGEVGSHKRMLEPVFTRTPFNKLVELLRKYTNG